MTMCTDTICKPEPEPAVTTNEVNKVVENHANAGKRPMVRFSFMGRDVQDLTDDEADDGSDSDQADEVLPGPSLEDEKRIIREQLLLISSQLGQLTGAEGAKQCARHKNRRHSFPNRKEKQKLSIWLPQDGKNGSRKRPKSTHSSPNTVMSATSVESFGLELNESGKDETVSIDTEKQDVDPLQVLQGIASATPTAGNDIKKSRQHNTDEVVSSGFVASFQMPTWRLAPEIDVPQYRFVDDYSEEDPFFGQGYNFLSAAWSQERIVLGKQPRLSPAKVWWEEESSSDSYQKSYRSNKRRPLPCYGDAEIEDTSDAVYQRLHHSQEKEEKERMTSLYNKRLKDAKQGKCSSDDAIPPPSKHFGRPLS